MEYIISTPHTQEILSRETHLGTPSQPYTQNTSLKSRLPSRIVTSSSQANPGPLNASRYQNIMLCLARNKKQGKQTHRRGGLSHAQQTDAWGRQAFVQLSAFLATAVCLSQHSHSHNAKSTPLHHYTTQHPTHHRLTGHGKGRNCLVMERFWIFLAQGRRKGWISNSETTALLLPLWRWYETPACEPKRGGAALLLLPKVGLLCLFHTD
jgi:hypothetical protein